MPKPKLPAGFTRDGHDIHGTHGPDTIIIRYLSRDRRRIEHTDGRHADHALFPSLTAALAWLEANRPVPWLEPGQRVELHQGPPFPGAGRPRVLEDRTTKSFELERRQAERIERRAKDLGVSESEVLRQILDRSFK